MKTIGVATLCSALLLYGILTLSQHLTVLAKTTSGPPLPQKRSFTVPPVRNNVALQPTLPSGF